MIRSVVLDNFLSYEQTEIVFTGAIISVTGENGSGKSALLEAIPYAYFGLGRETMGHMSRINGDGSHKVCVTDDNDVRVVRGRKANGKGFFEVYKADELVARGKDADAWVADYLGMDMNIFMLTAFFGLHDTRHDTLIKVTPALRLEALQKLCNLGPYQKFHKQAKSLHTARDQKFRELQARRLGLEEAMGDVKELQEKLSRDELQKEQSQALLFKHKERKEGLANQVAQYQEVIQTISGLESTCAHLHSSIEQLKQQKESTEKSLQSASVSVTQYKEEREGLVIPDTNVDYEKAEIKKRVEQVGALSMRLKLLHAVESASGDVCPLCNSTVSADLLSTWKDETVEIAKQIEVLSEERKKSESAIQMCESISSQFEGIAVRIAQGQSVISEKAISISKFDGDIAKFQADEKVKKENLAQLKQGLGEKYQLLQDDIAAVDKDIQFQVGNITNAERGIKETQGNLVRIEEMRGLIAECTEALSDLKVDLSALELLISAWNRYGIPLELMQNLLTAIESIASSVYREFDNSMITVEQVEESAGKPGVQFFLSDWKGKRTFSQLSAGEKVMFFISVRVAISQIISANNKVSVDYLILDEAMGNLSPRRRDDLIRVINKVLRKRYIQVIMVSHTEMPEIFSQTISVKSDNGISEIAVAV